MNFQSSILSIFRCNCLYCIAIARSLEQRSFLGCINFFEIIIETKAKMCKILHPLFPLYCLKIMNILLVWFSFMLFNMHMKEFCCASKNKHYDARVYHYHEEIISRYYLLHINSLVPVNIVIIIIDMAIHC